MSYTSEEEIDLSDSGVKEYLERCYLELKQGDLGAKLVDGNYPCPYCPGKQQQKQNFHRKDLLQHATDIGKGSQKRSLKEKTEHLALVRYIENDLHGNGPTSQPILSVSEEHGMDTDEAFAWPWSGILANIPVTRRDGKCIGQSGSKLRGDLIAKGFNVKVHPLWDYRGFSGYAIVEFNSSWSGFIDAMKFEKSYEAENKGKRNYYAENDHKVGLYGWVARRDDYVSGNIVCDYLRKHRDLKTISEVEAEDERKTMKLVSSLRNTLEVRNMHLIEMEKKVDKVNMSIINVFKQTEDMVRKHNADIEMIQLSAHIELQNILKKHEQAWLHLEARSKELQQREEELKKLEVHNEYEENKLAVGLKKYEKANMEQRKADQNVARLVEDHKMEKEQLHRKFIELRKQLDAKQALELEIESRKSSILKMKHIEEDEGDTELVEDLIRIQKELKEKEEELEDMEAMNQALVIRQRRANDELQDARKELINFMKEQSSDSDIWIKRMGELNRKHFLTSANRIYPKELAEVGAMELCSLWEAQLEDPNWYPFKVVQTKYGHEEIIDEENEKLKSIRNDLGEEVYVAVITALRERREYNASGMDVVFELWNYKDGRKATVAEGASHIVQNWKEEKRKKLKRKRNN